MRLQQDMVALRRVHYAIRQVWAWSNKYKSYFKKARNNVCVLCKDVFIRDECHLDHHPNPVVPFGKYWFEVTPEEYYDRVFNSEVRILCKDCHKKHTKAQSRDRADARRLAKECNQRRNETGKTGKDSK